MSVMDERPQPGVPHVHRIPVDPSQTAIEAWDELCIFGQRITVTGPERWANVTGCDGEQCHNIGVGSLV